MKKINCKLKIEKSFTLIELLVGITIFSLLSGAVIGILISGIKFQRHYLKRQQALDQLSFAIEYMGRALRMARKDDGSFGCLPAGWNYSNPSGEGSIKFINHLQDDECQEFFLQEGVLKYKKGAQEPLPLTSPNLQIEELKFQLLGQSGADLLQPRVTIFLRLSSPSKIELQTTVSQRNLDM